ncbi:DUF4199 domain-containing protein [Tenacibaculum agarivorans]|uniref:DUF4199 domain-containing protein n=1 Tax=Tenacibaculum agarivorans TaxID=1908389 RepID=UPI00094B8833|nr:DUF4199 domain-containing protein [Tenacibaculum agarivorans]
MENQTDSKGIILNYGLILGVIGIFIHLVFYATGNLLEYSWLTGVIGLIATVIIIVIGIKKFKTSNNSFLSFGQALKVGVGIAVVSAVISVIYTLIFTNMIEPDFQQQVMELQKQEWLESGMSDDQIETSAEMVEKFNGPAITIPVGIVMSAFIGFIISAIAGAVMQKKEDVF